MTAVSLGWPVAGHQPVVGRHSIGSTMLGGQMYGTHLSCSCGGLRRVTVSNEAPSRGGRADAGRAYRAHLVAAALIRMWPGR